MIFEEGRKLFAEGRYSEALEKFSQATMIPDCRERAMLGVARTYYRKEEFKPALERFKALIGEGLYVDYAKSMVAVIKSYEGNYAEAIKLLKEIPMTVNNLIKLSLTYYLQYTHDKIEGAIIEAQKALEKIDINEAKELWRIHLTYGMINQAKGAYNLAEKRYIQALAETDSPQNTASIQDEYGSLLIHLGRYGEAEKTLLTAGGVLAGGDSIEEGFNCKWLGILYRQLGEYDKAIHFLGKSAKILEEKGILKELAEVYFILLEVHKNKLQLGGDLEKNRAFMDAVDAYKEGMNCAILYEEGKDKNEKVLSIIADGFDATGVDGY